MNQEVEFPWEIAAPSDAHAPMADAAMADAAMADAAVADAAIEDAPAVDASEGAPVENAASADNDGAAADNDAAGAVTEAAAPVRDATPAPARGRKIARKEYYSIGEVSDLVGLPAHVLRYWESQFPVLNPSKNRSGNRAYQRKEIRLILLVKQLLYEDKYTVEGAKTKLDQLRKGGDLGGASGGALDKELMTLLRQDVDELRRVLAGPRA